MKYFIDGENKKKVQKDIDKIFKKVSKNKKYFISAKDLALADALIKDGFSIPQNFKYTELSNKFDIPKNLLKLIDNDQKAFLAHKIVKLLAKMNLTNLIQKLYILLQIF